ncbi:hypothetical protein SDRG_12527 [Saprolegnia diclina VS20]|uniref:Uncharacterized protein n=1 Tax=Saprolegnia diclina (strain VS20) TaxID=1156394 RepID=T0Q562_SAPDV|nr:hypothetical protein SDRG_12527 [Saprolegnia diclina VS20]EQC29756.1 hypothetical protein SDRG_12527 [Saprolegnia diclina VS20]|eukprot:XP_008616822.1 hypothetical protein SDRG_12527 [Saprolegnia diclina VS20]
MHLPLADDRKRHVYIIARLLNKGATRVPPAIVAKKLLRLATKMEQQLFEMTQGRPLGEDSIRQHLVALAHAACKRTSTKSQVEVVSV